MIRDRGRIKWVSMMLPEHVKLLREWAYEDTYEQRKLLDEQQWEAINELVLEAMGCKRSVAVTHFHNKRYEIVVGQIHHWDAIHETLHLMDHFGEAHCLRRSAIVDVQLMEE